MKFIMLTRIFLYNSSTYSEAVNTWALKMPKICKSISTAVESMCTSGKFTSNRLKETGKK